MVTVRKGRAGHILTQASQRVAHQQGWPTRHDLKKMMHCHILLAYNRLPIISRNRLYRSTDDMRAWQGRKKKGEANHTIVCPVSPSSLVMRLVLFHHGLKRPSTRYCHDVGPQENVGDHLYDINAAVGITLLLKQDGFDLPHSPNRRHA